MKQVQERQRELVERKAAAAREKENTLALVQLQAQALVTHAQEETTQRLKKPKFAVLTSMPITRISVRSVFEFVIELILLSGIKKYFYYKCFLSSNSRSPSPSRNARHRGVDLASETESCNSRCASCYCGGFAKSCNHRYSLNYNSWVVIILQLRVDFFYFRNVCFVNVLSRVHIRLYRVITVVIEESDSQANDSESQLSAFEDDFTHGDDDESDGSDDDDIENHENQMVQEMYALSFIVRFYVNKLNGNLACFSPSCITPFS